MEDRIIFQVKINTDEDFELAKTDLSPLEQAGLERFLESYLDSLLDVRKENIKLEYLEDEEE